MNEKNGGFAIQDKAYNLHEHITSQNCKTSQEEWDSNLEKEHWDDSL